MQIEKLCYILNESDGYNLNSGAILQMLYGGNGVIIDGESIPNNPIVNTLDFESPWSEISPELIEFLNGDFKLVTTKPASNLCISDKDFILMEILKKISIDADQVNSFNKSYPNAEIKKVYNEENITKFRSMCERLIFNDIYLKDHHVLHVITRDSKFLDT